MPILYPQNGESIVTVDSVTSFHTMYALYAMISDEIHETVEQK